MVKDDSQGKKLHRIAKKFKNEFEVFKQCVECTLPCTENLYEICIAKIAKNLGFSSFG